MKKNAFVLICAAFLSFFASGNVFCQDNFPFKVNPVADGIILGTTSALTGTAVVLKKAVDFPAPLESYDINDVNSFDRMFAQPYNPLLHKIGTVTCGASLALPVLFYGTEFALGQLNVSSSAVLGMMYLESFLLAYGIKDTIKIAVTRVRPYMYFDGAPQDKMDDRDFEFSFPSGHTTNAFLGASFFAYTFCQMYPDSNWKIPLSIGAYALATGTGILRMMSGNHFATDVITGALIGTACGIGIPLIHKYLPSKKTADDKMEVTMSPLALNFRINL